MYVHLGFEGKKSNGHREEIYKYVSMMKIIKILQKNVQIYQVDKKGLKDPRSNKKTSI
jgi:hypothetical protein